jgi:hypothetical protein
MRMETTVDLMLERDVRARQGEVDHRFLHRCGLLRAALWCALLDTPESKSDWKLIVNSHIFAYVS